MEIRLTEEDKKQLEESPDFTKQRVILSIGTFDAHWLSEKEIFAEMLGKKILDKIGVKCLSLWPIIEKGCVLKEPFDEFRTANALGSRAIWTLDEFKETLQGEGFENIDETMLKMRMLHFIDILFGNSRSRSTYGVVLDNHIDSSPVSCSLYVVSNTGMLKPEMGATLPISYSKGIMDLTLEEDTRKAEFENFFRTASDEEKKMMVDLLAIFEPTKVDQIMDSIENETGHQFECKIFFSIEYESNYKMVKKVIFPEKDKCADEQGKRKNYSLPGVD